MSSQQEVQLTIYLMKLIKTFLASIIATALILTVLAICIAILFSVKYSDVVHSVPFCIFAFFTSIMLMIAIGQEVYDYLDNRYALSA
jgi:hypothetical protein